MILPTRAVVCLCLCVGALQGPARLAAQFPDTLDGQVYQAVGGSRVTVWYAPGDSEMVVMVQ